MPRAKKLPSGSWRAQVDAGVGPDGKRHRESFTAATKAEAERMAAQYAATRQREEISDLTLGEAMDDYLARRSAVLSPATVKDYRNIRRLHVQGLMRQKLSRLTNNEIQRAINQEAMKYAPKTVRNVSGFISAVLGVYRPDFTTHIHLPQKERPIINVPDTETINVILDDVKGTEMELIILLAALGPMRRAEICALRGRHITGNTVHVCENMVSDNNGGWIFKTPKTYAGDRYIEYPDFVAAMFPDIGPDERLTQLTPNAVSRRFQRITNRLDIQCRFHDLRHYGASILHTMMPDQYIMQRGGWSSDSTLKAVYRHTLDQQNRRYTDNVNDFFSNSFGKMSHEMSHEN